MKKIRVRIITFTFWIAIGLIILQNLNIEWSHFPIPPVSPALQGQFTALTYNVAGLPEIISQSKPSINMPLIGKKISRFALALVQEDFWYNRDLSEHSDFPYKTAPAPSLTVGDGLGQFSQMPLKSTEHYSWESCNGFIDDYNDCLTNKGFSFSQMEIIPGIVTHVYNLHMDAGEDTGDIQARANQLRQLTSYIQAHSQGYPLIVAGDFNFHFEKKDSADLINYLSFLKETGLTDSCYATQCPEERLDRILYRNNSHVQLTATSWHLPEGFQDIHGEDLSDHKPVAVDFHYQITPTPEDMKPALASFNTNDTSAPIDSEK